MVLVPPSRFMLCTGTVRTHRLLKLKPMLGKHEKWLPHKERRHHRTQPWEGFWLPLLSLPRLSLLPIPGKHGQGTVLAQGHRDPLGAQGPSGGSGLVQGPALWAQGRVGPARSSLLRALLTPSSSTCSKHMYFMANYFIYGPFTACSEQTVLWDTD